MQFFVFKLQEYHDNIGDLDGPEEKERVQASKWSFLDLSEEIVLNKVVRYILF